MNPSQQQNIDWIKNLRVVALLAVITLHTSAVLLSQYGKVPHADWFAADFYNAMVRFAVPVFVMVTGALSLHREYEITGFLKKRLSRIVPPFLFWSLVYIGYSWYNDEISFDADAWTNTKQVLHLLKYGSSYHLWYVYMLIGLYFVIPVIGKFVRNATESEIVYFLVIWLAVMLLAQPYLSRFNPQVDMHYFAGYIGYLVLGHYLAFKDFGQKPMVVWMVILFVTMLVLIASGTWWLYASNSSFGTLFYEPVGPTIVLLASSAFLMARFVKVKLPKALLRLRDAADSCNYGMYLGHALILYLLELVNISYKLANPFISIPVTAITCFFITLGLIWSLGKLPFGKWIVG